MRVQSQDAMPTPAPFISIVVVCRNPGAQLATALASVWEQTIRDRLELIVIDGASTDGTPHWLEQNRTHIEHWSSQPDDGIYDAMNQGVAHATGQWVYFLGADDHLATPEILAKISAQLESSGGSIAAGTARFSDGRIYAFTGAPGAIRRNFLHHQATFYRRALFDQCGEFDTTLRLQADYEFNLRLLHSGHTITTLPSLIAHCASGGLSDAGRWLNYREEISVRHRYFNFLSCLPWDAITLIRYGRKKIVRSRAANLPA